MISIIWFFVSSLYADFIGMGNNMFKTATVIAVFTMGYSISIYFSDSIIRVNINRILKSIGVFPYNRS